MKPTHKYKPDPAQELPFISLIVTGHNEEKRIEEKLDNCLAIEYPKEKLQVIIASDCSTDKTDDLVRARAKQNIELVRADQHLGKEYAQKLAVAHSKGEIIVFSDVATKIPSEAFTIIAEIFSDTKIGALSSEDKFISDSGQIAGEGLYVQYEMWLRRLESERAGLVGLSGSFFAARRSICQDWDIRVPSDFNTALNASSKDFLSVTDSRIVGIYKDIKDKSKEYNRKVRTVVRGMTAARHKYEVLNPFKYGMFAFQLWSHKVMRWFAPWFMLATFILSCALIDKSVIYMAIFIAQLGFYGIVLIAHFVSLLRNNTLVRIAYFFVTANIAVAHASISFLSGKRITTWKPSAR